MFKGQKTYWVAGILAAVTFLKVVGYMDENTYQALLGFLGALGLTTMRSAIGNIK